MYAEPASRVAAVLCGPPIGHPIHKLSKSQARIMRILRLQRPGLVRAVDGQHVVSCLLLRSPLPAVLPGFLGDMSLITVDKAQTQASSSQSCREA